MHSCHLIYSVMFYDKKEREDKRTFVKYDKEGMPTSNV